MGKMKDALICGYYDERRNYIVEMDEEKLQKIISESFEQFKDFQTNITTKVKLYEYLKEDFTKNLNPECNDFIVDFNGRGEEEE